MKTILVTGANRSGTTWVGKMLNFSGDLLEVSEPFNYLNGQSRIVGQCPFVQHYPYVQSSEASRVKKYIDRKIVYSTYKSIQGGRSFRELVSKSCKAINNLRRLRCGVVVPLIKDPIALLSAEWVAREYQSQVVVMIRHPAAYVSSIKRVNWRMPLSVFLSQPKFMETIPANLVSEVEEKAMSGQESSGYNLEDAALCWKVFHSVIKRYQTEHPEWIFLRHEDLCQDYLSGFRDLFYQLSLRWSDEVGEMIHNHCGSQNSLSLDSRVHILKRDSALTRDYWKINLRKDEVARVRKITAEIADVFYDGSSWQ